MKKKPTPKFVCYDKNTPFRSEGTIIYGPKVTPDLGLDYRRVAHYECFICDCDNEVAADALVTILNEAWLAGKILGETQNPKQEPKPDIKQYDDDEFPNLKDYSKEVKDILKKKEKESENGENPLRDLKKSYEQKKKEATGKTESGQRIIKEQEEALKEFQKLQKKAIEIGEQKTPLGWYEQKWDD